MNLLAKQSNKRLKDLLRILFIVFLAAITNLAVFMTGGTKGAWTQLNFIIIVLSSYYWNTKGSLLIAFILGLIVGPFMPLDISQGVMQAPQNWLIRLLVYLCIAFITGHIFQKNDEMNEHIRNKDLINPLTGLYNTSKLFLELNKMIEKKDKFCLIFINITNLDEIGKYVDYTIVDKIIESWMDHLENNFSRQDLYSVNFNQFILVLKEYDEHDIKHIISRYLNNVFDVVKFEEYSFRLIAKFGIAFYDCDSIDEIEIFNKARIAADQGSIYESGIYSYDNSFKDHEMLVNEIAGSLKDALNNDEFYLVYQPIIDITTNTIAEVEVLLRWDRGNRENVGPNIFIDIAEKVGLITEVSKWVITKSLTQILEWESKGIEVILSINLTSKEILDDSFRQWARILMEEKCIAPSKIGIEITERVFSYDEKRLIDVLTDLKAQNHVIAIDDFGTGYNSLMTIGEIPSNIIKIDKYFIDRINQIEIKLIIRHLTKAIHEMNMKVIAEGVETKEQLTTLIELGFDKIQGYYFSKPLLPNDFVDYYTSFDINRYLE